jgi:site-specific recombinase XerD
MLSEIFVYPTVIDRMLVGPLGRYVGTFIQFMKDQGYARSVMRMHVRVVARLSRWLDRRKLGADQLRDSHLVEFARGRHGSRTDVVGTLRPFLVHLRQRGVVPAAAEARSRSFPDVIAREFAAYLQTERRLAATTVATQVRFACPLLVESRVSSRARLRTLDASHITDFVLRHARDLGAGTAQLMTTALRSFLRFLRLRGEIGSDLAGCVPTVPSWRLTRVPMALKAAEVRRLLRTCDLRTIVGRRDLAVLTLLVRLGLRGCEVAAIRIEDIDWKSGEITVHGKGSRDDVLPLPRDVGAALAAYARNGRPTCSTRNFFVSIRAPFRSLSTLGVRHAVARAVERAGLHPPHRGAHLLRHTAATEMLRRGASLGEIGEVLRHRKIDTTAIYAKVDLRTLRGLAQRWPGGAT